MRKNKYQIQIRVISSVHNMEGEQTTKTHVVFLPTSSSLLHDHSIWNIKSNANIIDKSKYKSLIWDQNLKAEMDLR